MQEALVAASTGSTLAKTSRNLVQFPVDEYESADEFSSGVQVIRYDCEGRRVA